MNILNTYYQYNLFESPDKGGTTIEDLENEAESILLPDVGHICLYRGHVIGVVVSLNPLTIINTEPIKYNTYLNRKHQCYVSNTVSHKTALKLAKEYKTSGTKKGSWHLPSKQEMENIGFYDFIGKDMFQQRKLIPFNSTVQEWLNKINKGLCCLDVKYPVGETDEVPESLTNMDYWCSDIIPCKDFDEDGNMYNTFASPIFTVHQTYTDAPNSKYLISVFYTERGYGSCFRLFCNIEKLNTGRYEYLSPEIFIEKYKK